LVVVTLTRVLVTAIGFSGMAERHNIKEPVMDLANAQGPISTIGLDNALDRAFNLANMVRFVIDGITCFTSAPLRFAYIIGVLATLPFLLYLFVILFRHFVLGMDRPPGGPVCSFASSPLEA
jgi:hypothetical protein